MAPVSKKLKTQKESSFVAGPSSQNSGRTTEGNDDDDHDNSSADSQDDESESESGSDHDDPEIMDDDADFPNEYSFHQRTRIELSPSPEPDSGPSVVPTALPSRINLPSRAPVSRVKSSLPTHTPSSSSGPSAVSSTKGTNKSQETAQEDQVDSIIEELKKKKTFSSIGVSNALIAAMGTMSIRRPTSIQEGCIPAILAGRDCIGLAQTGSGKTLAFALPILQRISCDPYGIWAVVLTPTRELAFQIAEQFHVLGVPLHIKTSVIVGGMDVIAQAQELVNRPHVIVATPGRLADLLKGSGAEWGLDKVQTLVLDEADRMLTPTFAADLAYIFSRLPEERQTCLFTATESDAIRTLEQREPKKGKEKIFVHKVASDTTTVSTLKQHYLFIPSHIRETYLYYLLLNPPESIKHLIRANPNPASSSKSSSSKRKRNQPVPSAATDDSEDTETPPWPPSTIIFTSRCQTAAHVQALLTELEIPSVALHSYLSQHERLQSLSTFRAGRAPVLVATDVGSRGLDIPEVALVVNWDCPRVGEDYVHRVGRTARAGRGGVAITMVTERDTELVEVIEKKINVTLTEYTLPEDKVLESLNKVSTAKRVAAMALHDSGFGEKQKNRAALEKRRQKRDAAKKALA